MSEHSYSNYKFNKISFYIDSLRKADLANKNFFIPSFQIGITDKCFNKCVMCGHWKRENKAELEFEQLIKFLDIAKNHGLESVGYSGGDPLAFSKINELMDWHIKNGVLFGLVCAGPIPNHIDLELLEQASWIRFSLDAAFDPLYKQIRGIDFSIIENDFSNKLSKVVSKNKGIGCTIQNLNIGTDAADILIDFALKNGITDIRFWKIREIDYEKDKIMELANHLLSKIDLLTSLGVSTNFETFSQIAESRPQHEFSRCFSSIYQNFIDANGNAFPCCTAAGDTRVEALGEPIYNINDIKDDATYLQNIGEMYKFSRIKHGSLPKYCNECIDRFIISNNFIEKNWNTKNFF